MTCDQFRRQLLIDPFARDRASRAHQRSCPDCARAAVDALAFEERLRAELEQSVREKAPALAGVAGGRRGAAPDVAGLLLLPLTLLLAWTGMRRFEPIPDWSDWVIGHILSKPESLRERAPVPGARVRLLLRVMSVDLDPAVGPVTYAERCRIGPREAVHLVVRGQRGPVTLLLMPGGALERERHFSGAGLEGLVVPAGFGTLAVAGSPGEALKPFARGSFRGIQSSP